MLKICSFLPVLRTAGWRLVPAPARAEYVTSRELCESKRRTCSVDEREMGNSGRGTGDVQEGIDCAITVQAKDDGYLGQTNTL
ncbi:hypothetical protein [Scytonema sp. UIC 10036]|uniref:hypothetical protein n=1 Tax=Scytonema sp. UIC 10036 TaxID=2304196 RepID=UPI001FAABCC4|nr:hypothetical protein [Scytonema sp. UIC 10036]